MNLMNTFDKPKLTKELAESIDLKLGLNSLKPSTFKENSNLYFCEGIYCYNADTHKPVKVSNNTAIYTGTFSGKYAECVFDLDGEEGYEKDSGNTKEYVLLTDKSIKV